MERGPADHSSKSCPFSVSKPTSWLIRFFPTSSVVRCGKVVTSALDQALAWASWKACHSNRISQPKPASRKNKKGCVPLQVTRLGMVVIWFPFSRSSASAGSFCRLGKECRRLLARETFFRFLKPAESRMINGYWNDIEAYLKRPSSFPQHEMIE